MQKTNSSISPISHSLTGQIPPAFRRIGESGSRGGNVVKISLIKMYIWEVQNEKTR